MADAKIRLYVDQPLGSGQSVSLERQQAHYLFSVMRLGVGASLRLFNGRDGEYAATVVQAGKRGGVLACGAQLRGQEQPPDLWLLFAPLKKARTDFLVEKATEIGVSRLVPVATDFTNAERVRVDRLHAHAIEAAEQCGSTYVPEVLPVDRLERLLAGWPAERRLFFCDESLTGQPRGFPPVSGPAALLIGPEGGFSAGERERIGRHPAAEGIGLGPRILRAETAAVSALTLWHLEHERLVAKARRSFA